MVGTRRRRRGVVWYEGSPWSLAAHNGGRVGVSERQAGWLNFERGAYDNQDMSANRSSNPALSLPLVVTRPLVRRQRFFGVLPLEPCEFVQIKNSITVALCRPLVGVPDLSPVLNRGFFPTIFQACSGAQHRQMPLLKLLNHLKCIIQSR
ncbi:hypothetical protein BC628DRAFT_128595 [Trametes gibbosa]|nr:hypothetical protein BC628DRAFT_128595 [Trametes gibbosa]